MKLSKTKDSVEDNDYISIFGLEVVLILELGITNVQERHFLVGVVKLKIFECYLDGVDDEQGALEGAEEGQVFFDHRGLTLRHVHSQHGRHHVRDKVLFEGYAGQR